VNQKDCERPASLMKQAVFVALIKQVVLMSLGEAGLLNKAPNDKFQISNKYQNSMVEIRRL
jgi:hypothetical protein